MAQKITIILDSLNRIFNSSKSTFTWAISNMGSPSANLLSGSILTNNNLSNISKIVVHKTSIPYNSATVHSAIRCLLQPLPNSFYFGNNFNSSQQPFHIEFSAEPCNNRIALKPKTKELVFSPALNSLDRITATFYNPYNVYNFESDNGYFTVIFGITTLFVASDALSGVIPMNSGDTVYILSPVNSPNAEINAALNATSGYGVTKIASNIFSIPLDTSAAAPYTETNVFVYFGSRRFHLMLDIFFTP
jgi:hypothetical protein